MKKTEQELAVERVIAKVGLAAQWEKARRPDLAEANWEKAQKLNRDAFLPGGRPLIVIGGDAPSSAPDFYPGADDSILPAETAVGLPARASGGLVEGTEIPAISQGDRLPPVGEIISTALDVFLNGKQLVNTDSGLQPIVPNIEALALGHIV